MYGVFIPDADTLRRVLDRPKQMLRHPHCAYLVYLARSVDGSAAQFLEEFGAAVDSETGEALAFIVLLDGAVLHGQNDPAGQLHEMRRYDWTSRQGHGWPPPRAFPKRWVNPRLPTLDIAETTSGSREVTSAVVERLGSRAIPTKAFYRANPEWSLKFAEHLGLNRAFLPCIVAMDDPGASDDDSCAVISLADAEAAWVALTDAISTYVAQPDTQLFVRAAERVRSAEDEVLARDRTLQNARSILNELERLEATDKLSSAVQRDLVGLGRAGRIVTELPRAPHDVLGWAAALTEPDRHTVAAAVLRAGADHPGAATIRQLLEKPVCASAARDIRRTLRRLRNTWLLDPATDNPHLMRMIAAELTAALGYLDRSPDALPCLIGMNEAAEREAFLALVETRVLFTDTELANCWSSLNGFVRARIAGVVRDEQIAVKQAEVSAAEQRFHEAVATRAAAESALSATRMSSFVPHLARAAGSMPGAPGVAEPDRPNRTAIAAGGTAFLADVVQILQGLGVLR